jgi:hypothetical protein
VVIDEASLAIIAEINVLLFLRFRESAAPNTIASVIPLKIHSQDILHLSALRLCYRLAARSFRFKLGDTDMRALVLAAFGTALFCTLSFAQSWEKISSTAFNNLTCLQIAEEGRFMSKRGFVLAGLQAGTGGSEGSQTKSAVIIVWPTAKNGEELAQADRDMSALEQASVGRQCSIQFQRSPKR